jgi:hypothetical protein
MAFSTAGGGPSRPEMNVTPLIDILLVLIMVFMVIVATSKEYVVNTQLPEEAKGKQPHQNERTILIQIIWSPQQKTRCSKSIRKACLGMTLSPPWQGYFSAARKSLPTLKVTTISISNMWRR